MLMLLFTHTHAEGSSTCTHTHVVVLIPMWNLLILILMLLYHTHSDESSTWSHTHVVLLVLPFKWRVDLLEPMSFTDQSVTTYSIVLVCDPHDEDDVESCGGIVEEFRHYGLHPHQGQDNCEKRSSGERYSGVHLQHLKKIHYNQNNIALIITCSERTFLNVAKFYFSPQETFFCFYIFVATHL